MLPRVGEQAPATTSNMPARMYEVLYSQVLYPELHAPLVVVDARSA
jgi:hypothetical protein